VRALVVGGGDRGLALARELVAEGHAVRMVSRDGRRREAIEAIGAECWVGTPDRIGSLRYALDNVTVLLWLLGRVDDADLHGSRLTMMLERAIDSTVRGVVYETGVPATEAGARETERMAGYNEIPYALVPAPGDGDEEGWVRTVREAIDGVLAAPRGVETR
jgi:NAD(P)-dependent dehydrogenase (short-subunit alcohol dehydrogenase family)